MRSRRNGQTDHWTSTCAKRKSRPLVNHFGWLVGWSYCQPPVLSQTAGLPIKLRCAVVGSRPGRQMGLGAVRGSFAIARFQN